MADIRKTTCRPSGHAIGDRTGLFGLTLRLLDPLPGGTSFDVDGRLFLGEVDLFSLSGNPQLIERACFDLTNALFRDTHFGTHFLER